MSTTTTVLAEWPLSLKKTSILTVSLARHLHGHDVSHVLDQAWSVEKVQPAVASRFHNVGFNLDPTNVSGTLHELEKVLEENSWDGLLLGWCVRGHVEFTELFESVVNVCTRNIVEMARQGRKEPKLLFCIGPEDLVNASVRSFPG